MAILFWGCVAVGLIPASNAGGLTLTRYGNTACAGDGKAAVISQLEAISACAGATCHGPSSFRLTGRVAPAMAGSYGFNVTFDPPLPYPSPEAYARLWVHDHLLYPVGHSASAGHRAGGNAPLWIPLPSRALNADLGTIEHPGAAELSSYEFRFEFVCMAAEGCPDRKVTILWGDYDPAQPTTTPRFTAIPASALIPTQSGPEVTRRALYAKLQNGWGTYYHPSMLTWVLLPESFAVKVGLYRLSTGALLSPEGLTANAFTMHQYAIRAGLHSYDNSYIEASVTWRDLGDNINVSIATTVDPADPTTLTMTATVNNPGDVNSSDFGIVLLPNFTHGRSGTVKTTATSVSGESSGLRASTLHLIQGTSAPLPPANSSLLPKAHLIARFGTGGGPVVLSTRKTDTARGIVAQTKAAQQAEAATLTKYGEWAEVKDAMQTSLMWSIMYAPKEGLVAPVTRNWGFSEATVDGDQTDGLFCWDGSFASYMLSLDALDWSFSNLIQIIKMRTSAGFIPSFSAGTVKTRDRSNPPVTAKILHEITKRWGVNRTKWVVELCFDDLLNWNTWMYNRRRETPLGMLSWGSNPFAYAPDGSSSSAHGEGEGAANLESGLDNGPVMEGVPFNKTGLYLEDEYDAGYTGMYLMDCQAQIALAKMIGRDAAAAELQSRFDVVNKAMLAHLWNESAGYFQNKLSADLAPVERMAPTHFYPLIVGPEVGPSESQAAATIIKHMTNPVRFAVWPSGDPPTDHPPPIDGTRPLVQWQVKTKECAKNGNCGHVLCCALRCNFDNRGGQKVRYEGMGIGSNARLTAEVLEAQGNPDLVELFMYTCGAGPNASDTAYGPRGWTPTAAEGPCTLANKTETPALVVYASATGPSAADLIPLESWFKAGTGHYIVGTEGKAEAEATGYARVGTLGYVWPPPGTENATSLYGLPSISKDDKDYIDQNYWHGRTWSPMIQLVYWGLEKYTGPEARGAAAGLVAQSKALLLKEWRGYGGANSYAGSGRYVYENFGADTGEGYGYSSEAQPIYSWGALAGFIGLQANGFYDPLPPNHDQ